MNVKLILTFQKVNLYHIFIYIHIHIFQEIVNGSSVMPENMKKKLEAFPDFKLITGAKVTKVEDQSNR